MDADRLARVLGRPLETAEPPLNLRYPPALLWREAAKGAAGAAVCLTLLLGLRPAALLAWPLGFVAVLATAYLGMQALRAWVRVQVDKTGVMHCMGRRCRTVTWTELSGLRLHFHRLGRRAEHGVLTLRLQGAGTHLKLDSTLHGFPALLQLAARAARSRELPLSDATADNLRTLGL